MGRGYSVKTWFDVIFENKTIRLTDEFPLFFLDEEESDRETTNADVAVDATDGIIPGLNIYAPFTKKASFSMQGVDSYDVKMIMRALRGLLQNRGSFFIRYEREPGIKYAVNKVSITKENVKNSFVNSKITLTFNCYRGYSETVGTTLLPFTFDEEVWAIGENITLGEDVTYTHYQPNFKIYNGSNIEVDPLMRHKLDIAISCVGSPIITNKTTGSVFHYDKPLKKSDLFLLSGVYSYKNGVHCGVDTNHGVITLAEGFNQFEISRATDIQIAFDFPFIYR